MPYNQHGDYIFPVKTISITSLCCLGGLIAFGMYGCPQYNVYSSRLAGEAELAKAEYSRQVAVKEANAKKDSAALLADAEISRAKGVAKANQIIGDSLRDNEAYLRYLWVNNLENNKASVIYVPTEAGLPILEAGRGIAASSKKP